MLESLGLVTRNANVGSLSAETYKQLELSTMREALKQGSKALSHHQHAKESAVCPCRQTSTY